MVDLLVVDDEYYICEGIRKKLEQLDDPRLGEVRTCHSGEEALALCGGYKPQIVITDIKMGGMDGIALIRELGKFLHPVQFVVLSGYDDFDYVKGAFQSGAVDYLLKPLMTAALKKVVAAALQKLESEAQPVERRGDRFRSARQVMDRLPLLQPRQELPEELERLLSQSGVEGRCFVALIAFESSLSSHEVNRRVNELYDAFPEEAGLLCHSLSPGRLCVLGHGSLREDLRSWLQGYLEKLAAAGFPAAASISEGDSVGNLPRLYRLAHEQLFRRVREGSGAVYGPGELPCNEGGFSSKVKHLVSQFIQNPPLASLESMQLSFSRELREMPLGDLRRFYSYFHQMIAIAQASRSPAEQTARPPSVDDFACFGELEASLFSRLGEYAAQAVIQPKAADIPLAVKTYVDEHFTEHLTLNELADRFFISYSHLSKSFHKAFHMTFVEYVYMLRMEYALRLLGEPGLPLQQIAARVGYDNVFNFSRAFKTYYGMAPSHYKKFTAAKGGK